MTTHWKTTVKKQKVTVYVITADRTAERNSDLERSSTARCDRKEAHARLAREAIGNYASARGLSMMGPPEEISATPSGLREVGWLCEYATAHNPVSISATVHEECAGTN
jgi:hypothetical protein